MSPRHVAIGLAAVAFAATAALGGLREAAPSGPAAAGPGTAIDAGPWTVTVKQAQLHAAFPALTLRDAADHWLVIIAEVEVTAPESQTRLDEILQLSDVDGLASARPDGVILLRGDSRGPVGRLHPAMREELAFVWERTAVADIAVLTLHHTKITLSVEDLRAQG